jgi:hypothetical protein
MMMMMMMVNGRPSMAARQWPRADGRAAPSTGSVHIIRAEID